ncbi:hypothetical protein EVAR_41215_1 [Eumeta japonica]|uniref:Uncharacterized protein n=1 Tax=Eumeta variegata TaxID=151549 RepID=A0A4C1W6W6_EUMVA|nr:hypothetical protein EVAR_41215_1 [Eumeta japonica]
MKRDWNKARVRMPLKAHYAGTAVLSVVPTTCGTRASVGAAIWTAPFVVSAQPSDNSLVVACCKQAHVKFKKHSTEWGLPPVLLFIGLGSNAIAPG